MLVRLRRRCRNLRRLLLHARVLLPSGAAGFHLFRTRRSPRRHRELRRALPGDQRRGQVRGEHPGGWVRREEHLGDQVRMGRVLAGRRHEHAADQAQHQRSAGAFIL